MITNEHRTAMIDRLVEEAAHQLSRSDGATAMRLTQAALNAANAYKALCEALPQVREDWHRLEVKGDVLGPRALDPARGIIVDSSLHGDTTVSVVKDLPK